VLSGYKTLLKPTDSTLIFNTLTHLKDGSTEQEKTAGGYMLMRNLLKNFYAECHHCNKYDAVKDLALQTAPFTQ
jgi:hypothetical protein